MIKKHRLLKQQIRYSKQEIKNTKQRQELGLYPKTFNFPIGLQFELTSKCNLYCNHCYNNSGEKGNKDDMTIQDWKNLVNTLIKNGGLFQCIISGGEPLMLGDNLFEIMNPLHDDGTGFVLITNGMLVNKNIVKKLKKYNFYWVQVSIDDVLDTAHDDFRGHKGSWEKAVNAAYLFAGAGFPLRIAHSVTPENIKRLNDMIDLAYKIGASSIVCGAIMPSGRATKNKNIYSNQDDFYNEMYAIIEINRQKYNGKMDILTTLDLASDMASKQAMPNSTAVIRPNGNVRMDCTMPFVIGNVLKENIVDIWSKVGTQSWNNPLVTDYIKQIDEFGNHPNHINHGDLDIKLGAKK